VLGRPESLLDTGAGPRSLLEFEHVVYSLPEYLGVQFWRAVAGPGGLRVEIEAAPEDAREAAAELDKLLREQLGGGIEARVVTPGTLVPLEALTEQEQFTKPQYVYREDDDLSGGVLYPRPRPRLRSRPADAPAGP
jgi:hypothetical protein